VLTAAGIMPLAVITGVGLYALARVSREGGSRGPHLPRGLPAAEGGKTPAIALTAYGRAQDRQRTLAAGYSMHVPKPVDPGELTAIIAGVAGRAR
jgi:CheY-like chemotaxis protein